MIKYYIYHIEGVKIGCSTRPKQRISTQGYTDYKILETHTDIMIASNREIELQKQYGYVVDRIPYYTTVSAPNYSGAIKSGKKAVESGQIKILCESNKIPILQYTKNNILSKNGKLIKEWKSLQDAANSLGILYTSISNCLRGESKSAGGYVWKYKGE
jgi:hypothetical protein